MQIWSRRPALGPGSKEGAQLVTVEGSLAIAKALCLHNLVVASVFSRHSQSLHSPFPIHTHSYLGKSGLISRFVLWLTTAALPWNPSAVWIIWEGTALVCINYHPLRWGLVALEKMALDCEVSILRISCFRPACTFLIIWRRLSCFWFKRPPVWFIQMRVYDSYLWSSTVMVVLFHLGIFCCQRPSS